MAIHETNKWVAKYGVMILLRYSRPKLTHFLVMDRDRRLTGFLRGQTDNVQAPAGFELNNPWRVGALYRFLDLLSLIFNSWSLDSCNF